MLNLKDIDDNNAGKYRHVNVKISRATHMPPKHMSVPESMQKLLVEYKQLLEDYHPAVKACLLHGEFVKVHPFIDQNSRIARLLLDFELMKHGYTPIKIDINFPFLYNLRYIKG